MQDDDDDDCKSVASQPVASTVRSPSPRMFRRGSGHFVSKPGELCVHLHHPSSSYMCLWSRVAVCFTPASTLLCRSAILRSGSLSPKASRSCLGSSNLTEVEGEARIPS